MIVHFLDENILQKTCFARWFPKLECNSSSIAVAENSLKSISYGQNSRREIQHSAEMKR